MSTDLNSVHNEIINHLLKCVYGSIEKVLKTTTNMNVNMQRFWKKRSVTITEYDPTFKALYLGNVVTTWAKGDGCADKPLATLWDNYCHSTKTYSTMKVTVTNAGLKAVTKEHGLTEYWANRITFCVAHKNYPKVFCWIYRHEGKKLKQELRCHAILCTKEENARNMAALLNDKLTQALQEFRREKFCRQKARLSLANCVYDNPSLPRRKILLSTGSANYRPPLERSKSAPKLMAIEEEERSYCNVVDDENSLNNNFSGIDLNPSPLMNGIKLNRIEEDNISDESGYIEEINSKD